MREKQAFISALLAANLVAAFTLKDGNLITLSVIRDLLDN